LVISSYLVKGQNLNNLRIGIMNNKFNRMEMIGIGVGYKKIGRHNHS